MTFGATDRERVQDEKDLEEVETSKGRRDTRQDDTAFIHPDSGGYADFGAADKESILRRRALLCK